MIYLPRITVVFTFLFLVDRSNAQVTFTLPTPLCAGSTATVSASTGTFPATSYQWFSNPSGPVFSSPNSLTTDITFSAPGIYTVMMGASAGASTSVGSQVVTVNPLPTLTLASTSPTTCAGQDATLTASGAASYTWTPATGLFFYSNSSAYISPSGTVSYTIVGTSSLGCIGSTSFTQQVNNYPTLVIAPGPSVVCAGSNLTLTANGATTYTWTGNTFTGGVPQSSIAVGAGTYVVVGANDLCFDTSTVFIGLAPGFTPAVSASRLLICINDGDSLEPITLTASGALNYSWAPYNPSYMTFSVGAITAVSPTASTCYTVTGTNPDCVGTQVVCVTVSTCTAIEEIGNTSVSWIFPNPVQDKLFFHRSSMGPVLIKIRNLAGQVMFEKTIEVTETSSNELAVGELSAGIYFVYFYGGNENVRPVHMVKQ